MQPLCLFQSSRSVDWSVCFTPALHSFYICFTLSHSWVASKPYLSRIYNDMKHLRLWCDSSVVQVWNKVKQMKKECRWEVKEISDLLFFIIPKDLCFFIFSGYIIIIYLMWVRRKDSHNWLKYRYQHSCRVYINRIYFLRDWFFWFHSNAFICTACYIWSRKE